MWTCARSAALFVTLALAGCGPRGTLVPSPEGLALGARESVLVATARAPVAGPSYFGAARDPRLNFARFDVSVPPDRPPGAIVFPNRTRPDPARQFFLISAHRLTGASAFGAAIDAEIAATPGTEDEASLFVHGFNVNFAEAVLRQAQMQRDLDRHDVAVLFSWPSAASARQYLYDRESVLFARPALEETIDLLARSSARQFNLIGHSMGAFLLMDAFSQMMRLGYDEAQEKINVVILLSPDIEVDVFKMQARPILERGVPIVIFTSRRDQALWLSALIRGEQDRLGSVRDEAELDGLPVTVYDVTEVAAGDPMDHFAAATSPALLGFLRGLRHTGADFFEYTPPPGRRTEGFLIAPDAAPGRRRAGAARLAAYPERQ